MEESLKEVKRRISNRHLGHHGIHGVGVRTSENALCLYVDAGSHLDGTSILREIEKEAAPFKIVLIQEERPAIQLPESNGRDTRK